MLTYLHPFDASYVYLVIKIVNQALRPTRRSATSPSRCGPLPVILNHEGNRHTHACLFWRNMSESKYIPLIMTFDVQNWQLFACTMLFKINNVIV